jgi:hypothetical protein
MKLLIVVGSVLAVGCGEDGLAGPDLSGMYQVTQMLESQDSCDPQSPVDMPDAFFLLEPKKLFGRDYFRHAVCTSADPATCEELGSVGPLDTARDDGWQGGIGYSSGEAPPCLLGYVFGIAIETAADTVRIDDQSYADTNADSCDPEEATRRGTSMPCVGSTMWIGTRVGSI